MIINERIAELEAKQEAIAKEIAELKEEAKNESLLPEYKIGDKYCFYGKYISPCKSIVGEGYELDVSQVYNIFPEEHFDKVQDFCDHVIKINNLLMQYKLALCPNYEPNWETDNMGNYYIYYDEQRNQWKWAVTFMGNHNTVFFDSDSAQRVAEDLNRRGIEP